MSLAATAAFAAAGLWLAWAFPRGVAKAERDWQAELAAEIAAAQGDAARAAAVNELYGDLDHALAARARWPHVGVLLAWAGWMLATLGGALAGAGVELLYGAVVALVAIGGCFAAGTIGRRRAERIRGAVDRRVAAELGDVALPARSRQRRHSRPPSATGRGPAAPFGAPPE